MALANAMRVDQRLRLSNSTCMRLQKDSITALSKQSPTEPIDIQRHRAVLTDRPIPALVAAGADDMTDLLDAAEQPVTRTKPR